MQHSSLLQSAIAKFSFYGLIAILLTIVTLQDVQGQVLLEPDVVQLQTLEQFQTRHSSDLTVKWNNKTGTPSILYGFAWSSSSSEKNPQALARQFLNENRALFKMREGLSDLSLSRLRERNGVRYIDFQQYYEGIPVFGAEYRVVIGKDNTVHATGGQYYRAIDASTEASVSLNQAVRAVGSQSGRSEVHLSLAELRSADLWLLPQNDTFILVYHLKWEDYEALVNAKTGKVEVAGERGTAHDTDLVVAADLPQPTSKISFSPFISRPSMLSSGATGLAYLTDPGAGGPVSVTLNAVWGGTLQNGYVEVTHKELDPGGALIPASNLHTKLPSDPFEYNYAPNSAPSSSCVGIHIPGHDCSYLAGVNVAYHITRAAENYWNPVHQLYFPFEVTATVHSGSNTKAYWDQLRIVFGDIDTFHLNEAFKDDVIYHEYSHIITGWLGLSVGLGSPLETRALNEGYADYFAASFTNDPRYSEWTPTKPQGEECGLPGEVDEIRILNTNPSVWNWPNKSTLYYGKYEYYFADEDECRIGYRSGPNTEHTWGMIWASALWDLRSSVGQGVADKLVLDGLQYAHGSAVTALEAIDGILAADQAAYSSAYCGAIWQAFTNRGFNVVYTCGPPAKTGDVTVGAVGAPSSLPKSYTLRPNYPNPFNPTTEIQFSLPEAKHVSLVIYDVQGREIESLVNEVKDAGHHRVTWTSHALPSGVYIYRLTIDNFTQARRMVLLK